MAIACADLLGDLGPLGHAAAQADDLLGIFLLGMGQGTQVAENPLLRMVPDGAGVQHNDVGPVCLVRKLTAHSLKHAHNVLAVGHVLLAAEGIHQGQRCAAALAVDVRQLPLKIPLAQGLLRR